MTISERILRKWRREALWDLQKDTQRYTGEAKVIVESHQMSSRRILKMTGELLDQHLLRK